MLDLYRLLFLSPKADESVALEVAPWQGLLTDDLSLRVCADRVPL